jgi:hypothetical protein
MVLLQDSELCVLGALVLLLAVLVLLGQHHGRLG